MRIVFWIFLFFKQKTAYEMRISDWSSDVCSSDLVTFRQADVDRQQLLLQSIRVKGLTVGRVLEERLQGADAIPMFRLGEELARFQTDGIALRLLFRPHDAPPESYTTMRSEEHTSELQSLMRISYAVFCLQKKTKTHH